MEIIPCNFKPTRSLIKSYLESATDQIMRHSLEIAKFERGHLSALPLDPQMVRDARPRRLYHVLPPLTGKYPNIGHVRFSLEGPHREIGVEIFAPTRDASQKRLRLIPDEFLEMALSPEQIQTLHTHSTDTLNPVGKMPIVIFSHGLGVDPSGYRPLMEEVASHGYAVYALNHPTSSASAVIDYMDTEKFLNEVERLASIQEDNIHFVVDQIRKKEGDEIPIVLAGHSLGGASSIMAARNDPKISGCINLDGGLRGVKKTEGLKTPLLMILSDPPLQNKEWLAEVYLPLFQEWTALYDNSKLRGDAYIGLIKDTCHMDFSLGPILGWLLGEKTLETALKAHIVASKAIVQFIKHLY